MKKKQRKKRKRYKEETKKGIYKLRSDQIDRKMFEHLNRIFIQGHGPVFEKGISLTKKIKQKILTELISCNSYWSFLRVWSRAYVTCSFSLCISISFAWMASLLSSSDLSLSTRSWKIRKGREENMGGENMMLYDIARRTSWTFYDTINTFMITNILQWAGQYRVGEKLPMYTSDPNMLYFCWFQLTHSL